MKKLVTFGLSFVLGQSSIAAAGAAPTALALAAVVGQYSSTLSSHDKSVLARLFDGDLTSGCSAGQKIFSQSRNHRLPKERR
jgi:hypothetical protein